MADEIENIDSPNDEQPIADDSDDLDALREQNRRFADQNRQLFSRAKKAEGFELKDGEWTKAEKRVEVKKEPTYEAPTRTPKSDKLDYGQLAFYNTTSETKISGEDVEFLKTTMEETGKPLMEIVAKPWFQAELKSRIEQRSIKEATPTTTKRSGEANNATDVAYVKYQQTGELPADPMVKREVIKRRQEVEGNASRFTDHPVVG